jgi:uncharacterized RDD family membrane protein YckC
MSSPSTAATEWPGKRLGLPANGPRSIGRLGRRLAALAIDWLVASGVTVLFFGVEAQLQTVGIFAVLQIVFISTLSGSIGHLIVGLRVVPLDPRWIGIVKPIVRTLLLSIVIPAVIWDTDQRGLHDKIAGTILVRR